MFLPSLLLWECMTSEISGLTRTAPIGIYAEERAWNHKKTQASIETMKTKCLTESFDVDYLCQGDEVGLDIIFVAPKQRSKPAKSTDHLVHDEKNVILLKYSLNLHEANSMYWLSSVEAHTISTENTSPSQNRSRGELSHHLLP